MMKAVNNNFSNLRQVCVKPGPFVHTINELSSGKQSTFHLVIPVKVELLQKLSVMLKDSEMVFATQRALYLLLKQTL